MNIFRKAGQALFGSKKEEVAFDPYGFNEKSIGTAANIETTLTHDTAMRAGAELFDVLDNTGRLGLSRSGDGVLTMADLKKYVKQFGEAGAPRSLIRGAIRELKDGVPKDFRITKEEFMAAFEESLSNGGLEDLDAAIKDAVGDLKVNNITQASVTSDYAGERRSGGAKVTPDPTIEV